jgi:hypothetical protein
MKDGGDQGWRELMKDVKLSVLDSVDLVSKEC